MQLLLTSSQAELQENIRLIYGNGWLAFLFTLHLSISVPVKDPVLTWLVYIYILINYFNHLHYFPHNFPKCSTFAPWPQLLLTVLHEDLLTHLYSIVNFTFAHIPQVYAYRSIKIHLWPTLILFGLNGIGHGNHAMCNNKQRCWSCVPAVMNNSNLWNSWNI